MTDTAVSFDGTTVVAALAGRDIHHLRLANPTGTLSRSKRMP